MRPAQDVKEALLGGNLELATKKLPAKQSRKGTIEEDSNVAPQADIGFDRGSWGIMNFRTSLEEAEPYNRDRQTCDLSFINAFSSSIILLFPLWYDIICFQLLCPLWLNWTCNYLSHCK